MKFNRWFVLALACLALLCLPVVRAEAAGDWQYSGSCGGNATWKLEDGVLTISGTGIISDYTSTPWYPVQDEVVAVVVEPGITEIGSGAFRGCANLQEVTIPSTVTQICNYAFAGCSNISRVNITDLNAWCRIVFGYDYDYSEDYTTSNPLHSGAELYLNGELVTELEFPKSGYEKVLPYAFVGCSSLTSIEIGGDVVSISMNAFRNCENLETVVLRNGLNTIGARSFENCDNLYSVEIPASVEEIIWDAFLSCDNLSQVHIADVAAWCSIKFKDAQDGSIDIESNPLYNGAELYLNDEQVTELVIPEGVSGISSYAFYNACGIETVVIPQSMTDIGTAAFYGCEDLTNVFVQSMTVVQVLDNDYACGNLIAYAEEVGVIYPYPSVPAYLLENFPYSRIVTKDGVEYMLFSRWEDDDEECVHEYESIEYAPTCEDEGYTEYTCLHCGDYYEDNFVPALDHDYQSGTVYEPTCEDEGYTEYTCSYCDEWYEDNFVEPLGHDIVIEHVDPTCDTWGYHTESCVRCGDWWEEETEPLGHNYVDGFCTNCGKEEGIRIVLTWGENPSDLDSHLIYDSNIGSGEIFYGDMELYGNNGELIARLDYDDTSSYGPETVTVYIIAEGVNFRYYVHDYSNGSNSASTELANSGARVEVYKGSQLLAGYDVPTDIRGYIWEVFSYGDGNIDELEHAYTTVEVPATCTEGGYTEYTCTGCGDNYRIYTDPLGHDYIASTYTAPTCTEAGYADYSCSRCGDTYSEELAPLGHIFEGDACIHCGRSEGIRIVLTWGENPSDLDSHLIYEGSNGRGEIFYSDKTLYDNDGMLIADLDVDDTTSFGPETITIYTVAQGEYFRYYVHDYSNRSDEASTALANSGAKVEVYRGDELLASFSVPTDIRGYIWEVFSYGDGNIDELEHVYTSETVAPTCTDSGYTRYTCTSCSDSYIVYDAEPLGHDYELVGWENGDLYQCSRCGDSYIVESVPTLMVGSVSGKAGDTVEVILTLQNAPALRALGIMDISYDSQYLTLIGGQWLLEGAFMTDWDSENHMAAAAYLQNTDVNGAIFKLTFQIHEDAPEGDYVISCNMTAKEKPDGGSETVVPVQTVGGIVNVRNYLPGDLNEDGIVDADDAVHLLMYVLFGDEYYPINQPCDFDGNGEVDTDDAIYLLYHTLFGELDYPLN